MALIGYCIILLFANRKIVNYDISMHLHEHFMYKRCIIMPFESFKKIKNVWYDNSNSIWNSLNILKPIMTSVEAGKDECRSDGGK